MTPRIRQPAFVGWMMLLVVLLSAVPTTGQARTRVIGSAFDPATYSVVVSPKKPRVAEAMASHDRKTPLDHLFDGAEVVATALKPELILPTAPLEMQLAYEALSVQAVNQALATRTLGPRGPPDR